MSSLNENNAKILQTWLCQVPKCGFERDFLEKGQGKDKEKHKENKGNNISNIMKQKQYSENPRKQLGMLEIQSHYIFPF